MDREYSKSCKLIYSKCLLPSRPHSVLYAEHELSPLKSIVYQNGKTNDPVVVIANCLYQFLSVATIKLKLPRAARRLFDLKGKEIKTDADLKKSYYVFVSCGEAFSDANYEVVKFLHTRNSVSWSLNGISFNKTESKETTAPLKTYKVLIYKNGDGSEPLLVTINGTEDLKEAEDYCLIRFDWHTPIKAFVNWNGDRVNSIEELIYSNSDSFDSLSPLWALTDNELNPQGCLSIVGQVLNYLTKWKNNKGNYSFLEYNDSERRLFKHFLTYIRTNSFEIDDLIEFLNKKEKELKSSVREYENNEKYIKEISTNDKIFGGFPSKGLKLHCFLNGTDTKLLSLHFNLKGLSHLLRKNEQLGIVLLLEEVNRQLENTFKGLSKRYSRVFNENGDEIDRLDKLEYNQKIWLSKGDDWKSSILNVLSLKISTLAIYNTDDGRNRCTIQNLLLRRDEKVNKNTAWKYCDFKNFINEQNQKKKSYYIERISQEYPLDGEVNIELIDYCLKCKETNLILYPEVAFDRREIIASFDKSVKDNQLFGWSQKDIQSWVIHKNGHITSRIFPQCYLNVFDRQSISVEITHVIDDEENTNTLLFRGYAVRLKACISDKDADEWLFNSQGHIFTQNKGNDYVLSCYESLKSDLDKCSKNNLIKSFSIKEDFDINELNHVSLLILEPVKLNENLSLTTSQQWAIKEQVIPITENSKHSVLSTPLWHELFYCWPVDENNQIIKQFTWPICGFLIPGAPPLKISKPSKSNENNDDDDNEKIDNPQEEINHILNDSRKVFMYHDLMVQMNSKMTIRVDNPVEGERLFVSSTTSVNNQFVFDRRKGYICLKNDKTLAVGVRTSVDQAKELVLMRRHDGDRTQQWIEIGNDLIGLKSNSKLVMSVDIKEPTDDKHRIVLETRVSETSNANQRVRFSEIDGTLSVFSANLDIRQFTAALKSNICTGFLFNSEIVQPGFTFGDETGKLYCLVCTEALKSNNNMKRLPREHRFKCHTKQSGETLSTCLESQHSSQTGSLIDECEKNISRLGKLRILNALKTEKLSIEVRRNGESIKQKGVLIKVNNIEILLQVATKQLGLSKNATKCYTQDGRQFTRNKDLINYYRKKQPEFEFNQESLKSKELQRYLNETNFNNKKVFNGVLKIWVPINNEKFIKP